MAHWQLDDKAQAGIWYDKSLAWREKNEANAELAGFFAETQKLLAPAGEKDAAEKNPKQSPPESKADKKKAADTTPDDESPEQQAPEDSQSVSGASTTPTP